MQLSLYLSLSQSKPQQKKINLNVSCLSCDPVLSVVALFVLMMAKCEQSVEDDCTLLTELEHQAVDIWIDPSPC